MYQTLNQLSHSFYENNGHLKCEMQSLSTPESIDGQGSIQHFYDLKTSHKMFDHPLLDTCILISRSYLFLALKYRLQDENDAQHPFVILSFNAVPERHALVAPP